MQVLIHPLLNIQIANHYTRIIAQHKHASSPSSDGQAVITGLLMGTLQSHVVDVKSSIELPSNCTTNPDSSRAISLINDRLALFKPVTGDQVELVGLYADYESFKQLSMAIIGPIMKTFNIGLLVLAGNACTELKCYEYPAMVELKMTSEASLHENIAIQTLLHDSNSQTSSSFITEYISALEILEGRISSIIKYLQSPPESFKENHWEIMRQINALQSRLIPQPNDNSSPSDTSCGKADLISTAADHHGDNMLVCRLCKTTQSLFEVMHMAPPVRQQQKSPTTQTVFSISK